MPEVIAARRFSVEDLRWFAAGSGDWNPIHVDAIAARRTIAGGLVVHGVFSLLWALEQHLASGGLAPRRVQALFRQTIHPSEEVTLHREATADGVRLSVRRGDEVSSIILSGEARSLQLEVPSQRPARREVETWDIAQMPTAKGALELMAEEADLRAPFPRLAAGLGCSRIASLMAYSRLIGMQCPGLHSLFTGLDIEFGEGSGAVVDWVVDRPSSPFAPLSIRVEGGGAKGRLTAFMRPAPVRQASLSELDGHVSAGEFSGRRALVIGGARGLGELTAKVLAVGGCDVAVTYRSGREDAERLSAEIVARMGRCRCFQFDAMLPQAISKITREFRPDLLFYFATPRIAKQATGSFDAALHQAYRAVYVQAYETIVMHLLEAAEPHELWASYPSTAFLDAAPEGFAEYVAAKREGEELCKAIMAHSPDFHAVIERFPRLATDQTMALIPQKVAPALPAILSSVRRIYRGMS